MRQALVIWVGVLVTAAAVQAQSPVNPQATQVLRGQLTPQRYTTLASEIAAKINRISAKEGQSFKAGQTLVEFDCALPQAQLAKSKAELDGSNKIVASNERLLALRSIGEIELTQAQTTQRKAAAEVQLSQAVLSKCAISAPFSGRVASQDAREQQFVQPGQALLDIIATDALDLQFLMPSLWLRQVKVGAEFKVVIDETGTTHKARIKRFGARVDPVSQSITVVATLEDKQQVLMAGMSGQIQLSVDR